MTAMDKVYDFDPYKIPREILEAIGLVTACYAQTETMIQEAIAGCAGVDMEVGRALTTHMTAPLRIDVLRALAEITIDDLDALDQLDALIDQFNAAAKKRNGYAHHVWAVHPQTRKVLTINESARGTLKAEMTPVTVEQIRADALFIFEVGMKFMAFLQDHGLLSALRYDRPPRGHKTKAARKKRREAKGA